jgi:hypothetical protein
LVFEKQEARKTECSDLRRSRSLTLRVVRDAAAGVCPLSLVMSASLVAVRETGRREGGRS